MGHAARPSARDRIMQSRDVVRGMLLRASYSVVCAVMMRRVEERAAFRRKAERTVSRFLICLAERHDADSEPKISRKVNFGSEGTVSRRCGLTNKNDFPQRNGQRRAPEMSETVSDHVVKLLQDWGVDTVFGLPGDGINGLVEAFRKVEGRLRYVHCRHEESAALAACAYAKFTGRLGVCFSTAAPGAVHLLNGLYDAKVDGAPVLAITGMTYHDLIGTSYLQDINQDYLYQDVATILSRQSGVRGRSPSGSSIFRNMPGLDPRLLAAVNDQLREAAARFCAFCRKLRSSFRGTILSSSRKVA